MGLLSTLQSHNARVPTPDASAHESVVLKKIRRQSEVNLLFQDQQQQQQQSQQSQHPSFSAIPTFFKRKQSNASQMVQSIAMQRTIRQREESLPSATDLQQLYQTLCNCASGALGFPPGSKFDYELFKNLAEIVPSSCGQFFTAATFSAFRADESGKIPIEAVYKLVVRKVDLWRARVAFSRMDTAGCGWLTCSQLEDYMHQMMASLHGSHSRLREADKCNYIQMAVSKFFFCLPADPQRRICIMDLLKSDALREMLTLQKGAGQMPSQQPEHSNWFSVINFERVYRMWQVLDADSDKMITAADLARFGSRTFTSLFISRLFQVHAKGDFLGFKGFCELLLACENKNTLPGIRYFFKILDLEGVGYLDALSVHAFVRTMGIMLMDHGHAIGGDDGAQTPGGSLTSRDWQLDRHCTELRGEVFDMVGSVHDNTKITVKDLDACGVGGTVVSMLTEMRGFWVYENRETPMHQPDPEPSPSPEPSPEPATVSYSRAGASKFNPKPSVVNSAAFQSYGDDDDDDDDDDDLYDFGSDEDLEDYSYDNF